MENWGQERGQRNVQQGAVVLTVAALFVSSRIRAGCRSDDSNGSATASEQAVGSLLLCTALEVPIIDKRDVPSVTDDDMIEHFDPEHLTHLTQTRGNRAIFG